MNAEAALAAAAEELTPIAVVDELQMERNLAAMAANAAAARLRLRPHAKTHKSVFIARRQLAHGAAGMTVDALQEADFAQAGVEDILVAHPPVGPEKLRRLTELAERVPRLATAIDSVEVAIPVPQSVEILWEVDSGLHRMGTAPGPETVEAVLGLVAKIGGDRIRGLMTHGGHAYRATDEDACQRAADEEAGALIESAAQLARQGL
jgi:D-serine deaminase-like pyridoxal phosphate-dependent protein